MTSAVRESPEAHDAELLRDSLKHALHLAGAFESRQALKVARDAQRLARRLRDSRSEAQALAIATQCHYQRGDYVSAVATGLDACATLDQEALDGRAHVLHGVALAFFTVQEFRRAEDAARCALEYASLEHESLLEAYVRSTLAMILCETGRFDESLAHLRLARARFRKLGEEVHVKKSASNAGHVWRKRGIAFAAAHEAAEARRCWRHATRFYRSALGIGRSRLDDAIALGCLGECANLLGHHEEAIDYLRTSAQRTGPRDTVLIVANIDLRRGIAERALGRRGAPSAQGAGSRRHAGARGAACGVPP